MLRGKAIVLLLRRERAELAAVALVTLLVAFTMFVFTAGIRLFERAADDGLQRQVAAAPVVQRTVQVTTTRSLFGPDAEHGVAGRQAEGEELRSLFPEPIQELAGEGNLAIGSTRLRVANPPDFPMYINLRYVDRFNELTELVTGRWPSSTGEQLPPVAELQSAGPGGPLRAIGTQHSSDPTRVFEIAVQESTARYLGLAVGSRLSVGVDLLDPMFLASVVGRAEIMLAPTELEITGLYRVRDPSSDAWFGDPRLRIDDLGNTGADVDTPIAYITGYVPPDTVPGLVTSGLPFEYRWHFPILIDRLDADAVGQTERGLRLLESRFEGLDADADYTAQAGFLPLLVQHSNVRTASQAVLALGASGPLALATGAIAMAAILLGRRRRRATIVARGRGASGRLLLVAGLVEALGVTAIGGLAGLGLAMALAPEAELLPSLAAAASIGLVSVVVLAAAAWPQIRRPLLDLERGARPARGVDPRRLVAELGIVALAAVGVYVLRQRGLAGVGSTSAGPEAGAVVGFDPFLAAVPPLIGLAVAIVALRLYPPAMAAAGWVADRRRDLVPVLGLRTVARGAASSLPALVLILAVAFAGFTSVVTASVDQAQQSASWNEVGADVRLEPAGSDRALPTELDPAALAGVTAAARGFSDSRVRASAGAASIAVTLQAVDAAGYAAVTAGSPIQPSWPAAFASSTPVSPVPAIIGSGIAQGPLGLRRGDTFQLTVLGGAVAAQVLEVRSAIAGLVPSDGFIVVPWTSLEAAVGQQLPVSSAWLRIPAAATADLAAALNSGTATAEVVSRYDAYDALRDEPLLGAVGTGFVLAFGVSVTFAILTILGAVILSAARRTRDLAILRTLGLDGGQQTRLTLVEHAPPILIALPLGLALGIGVAVIVGPALALGALSGSAGDVPLAVDWLALTMLSVTLAGLALAAVLFGSWLSRRAAIINALRITSD